MKQYSVKQLSQVSGVTVRTLHYYDQEGLLKPAARTTGGYRFYGEDELLRLQQILFYKTLGFPLRDIKAILDEPGFDLVRTLRNHRKALEEKTDRLFTLMETIDKTINKLTNKEAMKDDELYAGFTREQREEYRKEATKKWGEASVIDAEENLRSLGSQGYKNLRQEGEEINEALAAMTHLSPDDQRVQQMIHRHYLHMNAFRKINKKEYEALGEMYTQDERFMAYYEKYTPGLADFLCRAIAAYCRKPE